MTWICLTDPQKKNVFPIDSPSSGCPIGKKQSQKSSTQQNIQEYINHHLSVIFLSWKSIKTNISHLFYNQSTGVCLMVPCQVSDIPKSSHPPTEPHNSHSTALLPAREDTSWVQWHQRERQLGGQCIWPLTLLSVSIDHQESYIYIYT